MVETKDDLYSIAQNDLVFLLMLKNLPHNGNYDENLATLINFCFLDYGEEYSLSFYQ
jgi:hypothetical protein